MISGTRCSKSSTTAERKSCFPTKVRPAVLKCIAAETHVKRDSGGAICAARVRLCPLKSVNVRFPSRAKQACALQQTFALTPHAECKYCLPTQVFPPCSLVLPSLFRGVCFCSLPLFTPQNVPKQPQNRQNCINFQF